MSIKPTRVVDGLGLFYKLSSLLVLFGLSVGVVFEAWNKGAPAGIVAVASGIAAVVGLVGVYFAASALKCHEIDQARDEVRYPRFVFFRGRIALSEIRRFDFVLQHSSGFGLLDRGGALKFAVVLSGAFGSRTISFWSKAARTAFVHALEIAREDRQT